MLTRVFSKDFMQSVVYGDNLDTTVVSDEIIDQTRWSVIHEMVFMYGDIHYLSKYREGATEYQNEAAYKYEDNIVCTVVEPIKRVITVYEPVKDGG